MSSINTYKVIKNDPAELQTGAGLWKIELFIHEGEKQGEYEIFSYNNFIADSIGISGYPTINHVKKFAEAQFLKWYQKEGNQLPSKKALIVTFDKEIATDTPDNEIFISQQVRTNINLPQDLYDWAKRKAFEEKISLSELIRQSLSKVRVNREETDKWFISRREQVVNKLKQKDFFPAFMEICHYLPENSITWDQTKLLEVAKNSVIRHTGWPIGLAQEGNSGRPYAVNDGIETEYILKHMHRSYDYWYLSNFGDYYFARSFNEDSTENIVPGTILWFDIRIRRIAESIEHAILIYQNLNIADSELVRLKVGLYGIGNRQLDAYEVGRSSFLRRISTVNQIAWEKEVTYKILKDKRDEFIYDAVRQILVIFDFFDINKEVVMEIVKDYRSNNF